METGLIKLNPELMALISGKGGSALTPFQQEILLIQVDVAGTGYCDRIRKVQKELLPGMQLTLRRHPDNEYDEFAIGIYHNNIRIGWVPMKNNLVVARLMDAGKLLTCKIDSIEPDDKWPEIEVSLYLVD